MYPSTTGMCPSCIHSTLTCRNGLGEFKDIRASQSSSQSLAYPLYFASRGHGHLYGQEDTYSVKAKVYLSGLGADEYVTGIQE